MKCDTVCSARCLVIFQRNILCPASGLKVNKQGECSKQVFHTCLTVCLLDLSCSFYFSILKMEEVHSSKILVNLYQTTQHYTPQYSVPNSYCHEII
jgi:hypothetical protein